MIREDGYKILSRVKKSDCGEEFIELLNQMLIDNHIHILTTGKNNRDELVGYGNCLFDIVKGFSEADEKLTKLNKVQEINTY